MAKLITSPVELGFSEFVSKLIADTFDAVITSTITQEENWAQLNDLLSLDLSEFSSKVIDEEQVQEELTNLFPDGSGGTMIVVDGPYVRANPKNGTQESPPVNALLGYQPRGSKLSEKDVAEIRILVRNKLAVRHFEVLSRVFSKGSTRIVVDAGKINAKLNFEILQVEENGNNNSGTGTEPSSISRIYLKRKYPGFNTLGRPLELRNVHLFVKPPADKDPQSHQIKANVYGEVELQFKTVT